MFEPAPLELCKTLQKMGCKSDSEFIWQGYGNEVDGSDAHFEIILWDKHPIGTIWIPVFLQNDFTGATDLADENCQIVWPSTGLEWIGWDIFKKNMVLCHHHEYNESKETWWQYLERTMKKFLKNEILDNL